MQILFPDPTYDHEESRPPMRFAADLKREASTVSVKYKVEDRNFGGGADWPMFLIVFAALFAVGKNINDNIDGWIGLAAKLWKFREWLTSKCKVQ